MTMPPPSPRRHAEHAADDRVTTLDRVLGSLLCLVFLGGLWAGWWVAWKIVRGL